MRRDGGGRSDIELIEVRTGGASVRLTRDEFRSRFRARFLAAEFGAVERELAEVEQAAWRAYEARRKSARTRPAGTGFADPSFELDAEWLAGRAAIRQAQVRHDEKAGPDRMLVIAGAARSDQTCPGEISKTSRLVAEASEELRRLGTHVDMLDLSRLQSEYGLMIHPCKGCASTAMPLCHWPCSCYPNHALGQTPDWMHEILALWVGAHGVMIVTPVYSFQVPSPLKLMMDRMICSRGGNPDPTSTHGKDPARAKALELSGWSYRRHLAGRTFSLVVHGDTAGAESVRRALGDWLCELGLEPAGPRAVFERYLGYYEPYATSHDELDASPELFEETRIAARILAQRAHELRTRPPAGDELADPRPK